MERDVVSKLHEAITEQGDDVLDAAISGRRYRNPGWGQHGNVVRLIPIEAAGRILACDYHRSSPFREPPPILLTTHFLRYPAKPLVNQ